MNGAASPAGIADPRQTLLLALLLLAASAQAGRQREAAGVTQSHGQAAASGNGASPSELIVKVAEERDRAAFVALFRHFGPRVKSYLLRLGATETQADDLVQETMLTVWRKADRFDPAKAQASTWVFTIARNRRIDTLRRARHPEADMESLRFHEDEGPRADETLSLNQRRERVRAALQELPEEQAHIMRLSFFDERSHSEIARHLDIPLGTVKSRLRLAMNRVRVSLGEEP